jgi:hypothetical protein
VTDRSIIVRLERTAARDKSNRKRGLRYREVAALRERLVPHLVAHASEIGAAIAQGAAAFPPGLHDRAQDNWDALLAVADLAGGHWPTTARCAAQALSAGDGSLSLREQLISDLRDIVREKRIAVANEWRQWRQQGQQGPRPRLLSRIRSTELVTELLQREDRPWPEYGKDGRGITPQRMAAMLKPFGLAPRKARVPVQGPLRRPGAPPEPAQVYDVGALRRVFRQYA